MRKRVGCVRSKRDSGWTKTQLHSLQYFCRIGILQIKRVSLGIKMQQVEVNSQSNVIARIFVFLLRNHGFFSRFTPQKATLSFLFTFSALHFFHFLLKCQVYSSIPSPQLTLKLTWPLKNRPNPNPKGKEISLEQWKKGPWLFIVQRGWIPTQLYGDYFINREIRIPFLNNQPSISVVSTRCLQGLGELEAPQVGVAPTVWVEIPMVGMLFVLPFLINNFLCWGFFS